ncbi:MAG: hypothetical protein NPIRA05_13950 [Nitrospirales bacterium]|nr:MAG: hypothetical protein NPIRA05_13950 [Nitrospirales bacterium]
MTKIVAISAGMLRPKKGNEGYRKAHRYLNYGLLSLASLFPVRVPVLHGNFVEPERFVEHNQEVTSADVILLSLPSFYAVPWAKRFLIALKKVNPRVDIHVGGRWVVDYNEALLKAVFPRVTRYHRGLGEGAIADIASIVKGPRERDPEYLRKAWLDYSLLQDATEFQPSVEVSRGCGLGCAFCEESALPLQPLRDPIDLFDQIESIRKFYPADSRFYFESSFFAPSQAWTALFEREYRERQCDFQWRTESRVDVLDKDKIEALASAGLRVIDLGLESGSPEQLINMGKTRNPDRYLLKASELLNACHSHGVKAKVNILLYPGETARSVQETYQFLDEHEGLFFGLSTYPVVVYGEGIRRRHFEALYRAQGATGLVRTDTVGVWDVHLSETISAEEAKKIAIAISQRFMSMNSYFYLKAFSYFRSSYGWQEFVRDVSALPDSKLAFSRVMR